MVLPACFAAARFETRSTGPFTTVSGSVKHCRMGGREGAAACDIQGSCGSGVVRIGQIWPDLLSASQLDSVIVRFNLLQYGIRSCLV